MVNKKLMIKLKKKLIFSVEKKKKKKKKNYSDQIHVAHVTLHVEDKTDSHRREREINGRDLSL